MKKYLIFIVGIIIGVIGTSYAAYKLKAEQVSFDKSNTGLNSDNVQEVLDELTTGILSYGDALPSDIKEGKTALVNGKKIIGTSEELTNLTSRMIYIGGANGGGAHSYSTAITTQISGNQILLLKGRIGTKVDYEEWVYCGLAIDGVGQTLKWNLISSNNPTMWYATVDKNIDVGTSLKFKLTNNDGDGNYIGCAAFLLD